MLRLNEYVKFQQFQNKLTLGVRKITKYLGVFQTSPQNMQKMRCFLEKFTQLARILQDRRSRRS